MFKQLLEKALHLKIIRGNKKTKFDRIIIFSVLITLMALIFSNLTIEETFVTCISMMFLIIIIFQLFAMRNLKKVHYIILNIITVAIYLTLLAYVMNIYIILVTIITVFCVYNARNKNIESIQIIQKEFHIHDKNGNELRFNYQNHNLFTYHDNLKTINNTDDINKILNSIGINEFEVVVENKCEEITDVNEITLKNIYYITTKLAKPKINIENLNIKQIDQPIEYFWEHKNVKEFGV